MGKTSSNSTSLIYFFVIFPQKSLMVGGVQKRAQKCLHRGEKYSQRIRVVEVDPLVTVAGLFGNFVGDLRHLQTITQSEKHHFRGSF